MKIMIEDIIKKDNTMMRQAYVETLSELARKSPDIVALDSDLMLAMGVLQGFAKEFPDRAIDCGIMEANMIGVAAGMSSRGKIPFTHTFAPFATRRVCDQVFVSAAYAKLNVKIVGSDPGIETALNGGTHMPFEDMGIMRGIPEITAIEMTDNVMLKNLLPKIAEKYGVFYLRMARKEVNKIFKDGTDFEIGKSVLLNEGNDATIIASGFCVAESLRAAKILKEQGINVRVLNMFTWKPIDEQAIISAAKETGAIVTAENHNVINGLGSAVAEVLSQKYPVVQEMIGVKDEFGEVGTVDYLAERFKLTERYIVEAVKKAIERKNR